MDTTITSHINIPKYEYKLSDYLDRSIVIYGPSGSGKSTIILNILKYLNGKINMAIVYSPTEPSNKNYTGIIDPAMILYEIKMVNASKTTKKRNEEAELIEYMQNLFDYQTARMKTYKMANDIKTLSKLVAKIKSNDKHKCKDIVEQINSHRVQAIKDIEVRYSHNNAQMASEISKIDAKFNEYIIDIFKQYIKLNEKQLWDEKLTEAEINAIKFIEFNPRILLIFDDCADMLEKAFKNKVFSALFFRGRHAGITFIMSMQSYGTMPKRFRTNAFISIFTKAESMNSFFENDNNFSKQLKKKIIDSSSDIFVGYRKCVYIRDDNSGNNFYHMTFPMLEKFRFGSRALHEYCDKIQIKDMKMTNDNKYYKNFMS